jgi:hypothetical protein
MIFRRSLIAIRDEGLMPPWWWQSSLITPKVIGWPKQALDAVDSCPEVNNSAVLRNMPSRW